MPWDRTSVNSTRILAKMLTGRSIGFGELMGLLLVANGEGYSLVRLANTLQNVWESLCEMGRPAFEGYVKTQQYQSLTSRIVGTLTERIRSKGVQQ